MEQNYVYRTMLYDMITREGWLSPTERASVSAISLRHILASPGTIAVNVTWMNSMLVKRIAACTHLSSTVYELYSEMLVGNCNFFLTPPLGVFPLEFREKVWPSENENHGATRQWRQFDDRLSRFDAIPASPCTGGQTDVGRPAYYQ